MKNHTWNFGSIAALIVCAVAGVLIASGFIPLPQFGSDGESQSRRNDSVAIDRGVAQQQGSQQQQKSYEDLKAQNVHNYGKAAFFKVGTDVYFVNYNSFESEYSRMGIYHFDFANDTVSEIDADTISLENGKIMISKNFAFEHEELYGKKGNFVGYAPKGSDITGFAQEIGIPADKIIFQAIGGKPTMVATVEGEYSPRTKTIQFLGKQTSVPVMNFSANQFEYKGKMYPGTEFTHLGYTSEGIEGDYQGVYINFNPITKVLSLSLSNN